MMFARTLVALLALLSIVGSLMMNAGYSWGWEARDHQEQCPTTAAERDANVRRIDAALRGFIDDDRH